MHIEQEYNIKIKVINSCKIFQTTYHNDSYLLLFGERKL